MRREFYKAVMELLKDAALKKRETARQIEAVTKKIDSGDYSEKRIAELQRERAALTKSLRDIDYFALKELNELIEDVKRGLNAEVALNGSDVTDDTKLLAFNLTEREVVGLLEKNLKNPTMTQLILKYANERGLKLGLTYAGNKKELNALNGLPAVVETALRQYKNLSFIDRVFDENNSFKALFDIEDRKWRDTPVVTYSSDAVGNAIRMLTTDSKLSETAQRELVREFSDHVGVMEMLRDVARSNKKGAAVDELDKLIAGGTDAAE